MSDETRSHLDGTAQALAFWATYLLVFSWLPLVRSLFDGDSYRWATTHFGVTYSSAGIGPDLWLPVLKVALLTYLLWGLLRGSNSLHRWTLVGVNLAWLADAIFGYVRNPDGLVFHGDTLGITLNLGPLLPAVTGVFVVLSVLWFMREGRREKIATGTAWTPANHLWLWILVALLPIQFALLRFGAPHGTTDAIGVLMTIAQPPLLATALYPRDG